MVYTIDLHSLSRAEALETLDHELFQCFQKKIQECCVVHGIGEGILADAVHAALSKNPMVRSWREDEIGGSCTVYL